MFVVFFLPLGANEIPEGESSHNIYFTSSSDEVNILEWFNVAYW